MASRWFKSRRFHRHRSDPREPALAGKWLAVGASLLSVAIIASVFLALGSVRIASMPGCGAGSGCERAAASGWGKVPGLGWPVSFLGLAYFIAVLTGWLAARGATNVVLRNAIRVGAAISVIFVMVMIVGGYWCIYCLVAHLANLAFWGLVERRAPLARRMGYSTALAASGFVLVSVVLGIVQAEADRRDKARAEHELAVSTEKIVTSTMQRTDAAAPQPTQTENSADAVELQSAPNPSGFTGRYARGPRRAAIRIVAISDFQCPICRQLDDEIVRLIKTRDDVSFSMKHYPACADCNESFRRQNVHPNACRAAEAAEAAGLVGGDEAFWAMAEWIFARNGEFDFTSLVETSAQQGLDTQSFLKALDAPATREQIQRDIDEALSLGISHTPMVFINGVELEGGRARDALHRVVRAVAEANPPALTAEADRPPTAAARILELWRAAKLQDLPSGGDRFVVGRTDAPVGVVLWGDYQEKTTNDLDAALRRIAAETPDMQYSYRHFPLNPACNAATSTTVNLMSCFAARASEAAGVIGGQDAFWRMHQWLMDHSMALFEEALRGQCAELGLDDDLLIKTMDGQEVTDAIAADVEAARALHLDRLPWVYVNGRRVPVFHGDGEPVLRAIIEAEAKGG